MLKRHFVTFYSPGTFVAENTEKPIDSWDISTAVKMAEKITERYNSHPYGFRFTTRGRTAEELDSKEIARSPMYYIRGKVETLAQVEARNDPNEHILRSNMRNNHWDRIVTSNTPWKWSQPLEKDDVVLDEL